MDTDDLEPPGKPKDRPDLETLSIEALGEMIEELRAEISRIEEVIAAKKSAHDAASGAFKN
jgi:uncharacterized small protein (DUF1192 family)